MINDTERREVARRLREGMENRDDGFLDVVESAVFGDDLYHSSESTLERLADLIEPSEPKVKCVADVKVDGEQLEKLVHDAVVEYAGVDREALLELADEIRALNENADIHLFSTVRISDTTLLAIERRIREAVGA